MQYIDLKPQHALIHDDLERRFQKIYEHGRFVMGPEIEEAEAALAEFCGAKHCITVGNGTDAILVALMALNIGPGDEVITPAFSFFATAEMIVLLGAKPVFVDIDPRTYNTDPQAIEAAITKNTKAIMPVSLYGQCADFDVINAIAAKYNLPVIEDAGQSYGASYKNRRSCNLSTLACTSFFPSKPLGCYGEGGACFTNDDRMAVAMREVRNHGSSVRYHHTRIGLNARFDTMQAAVILAKLKVFAEEIERRQQVAAWYKKSFGSYLETPYIEPHNLSVYAQYTVRVAGRDQLAKALQEKGIPTSVHYPVNMHRQPVFGDTYKDLHLPHGEHASETVLSLPFDAYKKENEIKQVAETLLSLVSKKVSSL